MSSEIVWPDRAELLALRNAAYERTAAEAFVSLASTEMVEIGGERRAGATGDESGAGAPRW